MAIIRTFFILALLAAVAVLATACGSDSSSTISPTATGTAEPVATPEVRAPSDTFTSVHFADAQTGWVSGYLADEGGGVILATTDGGATWQRQYSGVGTISSLQFIDLLVGWAVMTDSIDPRSGVSTVLHTTDGGRAWNETGELEGQFDPQFVSPTLGRGWLTSRERSDLLETTDGGQTWASVPTETELGPSCFDDGDRGWSIRADGQVLRTDDGGRTWRDSFTPPAELRKLNGVRIWCDGENIVWIRLFGEVASNNHTYAIYRTLDAGDTWQPVLGHQVPQLNAPDSGPQVGPVDIVDAMSAFYVNHCLPCGSYQARIWRTTDGGATWDSPAEIPGLGYAGGIDFLDANRGWAVGPSFDPENAFNMELPAVILATTDGGRTWTRQYP